MATDNEPMHALIDLCEAVGKQPIRPGVAEAYERALDVIRRHTKPDGDGERS